MNTPRMTPPERTRLAPSPTGALHLGNIRTFLVTWAIARQRGWRIALRIEDLDTPRNKAGAAEAMIETLGWLGLDWDEGPVIQTDDIEHHREAMRHLAAGGWVYPCVLTRSEIEAAASAPQEGVHETVYPASLRPGSRPRVFDREDVNWRVVVPDAAFDFRDGFLGHQSHRPGRTVGDFVVWTRRGQPAYQLAVVVDDHRQGVTQVVRGSDLLDSTARQMHLHGLLGLGTLPTYTHLPLIVGTDGRRLAKRHGDTRIEHYRARGVSPERIIGLMARWCGIRAGAGMSAEGFLNGFRLDTMSRDPVIFTSGDEQWLQGT